MSMEELNISIADLLKGEKIILGKMVILLILLKEILFIHGLLNKNAEKKRRTVLIVRLFLSIKESK